MLQPGEGIIAINQGPDMVQETFAEMVEQIKNSSFAMSVLEGGKKTIWSSPIDGLHIKYLGKTAQKRHYMTHGEDEKDVELTQAEYDFFLKLVKDKGTPIKASSVVAAYASKLRLSFGNDWIKSIKGLGYFIGELKESILVDLCNQNRISKVEDYEKINIEIDGIKLTVEYSFGIGNGKTYYGLINGKPFSTSKRGLDILNQLKENPLRNIRVYAEFEKTVMSLVAQFGDTIFWYKNDKCGFVNSNTDKDISNAENPFKGTETFSQDWNNFNISAKKEN